MRENLRRIAHAPAAFTLVITLLAFALRVYHLSYQSLWRDESDALRFATQQLPDLLSMFTARGQNGPFFFLLLRPWVAVAGHSEFALRFLSVCFGTLSVPITARLIGSLSGRLPAACAALVMAITPYLVWYGQEAKMYALLTLLVTLEMWLLVLAVRERRWRYWVAVYIATGLTVYTHMLAALVVPVQLAWILLIPEAGARGQVQPGIRVPDGDAEAAAINQLPHAATTAGSLPRAAGPARRGLWALIYLAALTLPYLPILRWALPMFLSFSYDTGFTFVPLPTIFYTVLLAFTRGPLLTGGLWMGPVLLAAISGALLWGLARGRGGWRVAGMLLTWLLLPPLGIYVLSLSVPIFTERYLIWAMPGFIGLVALGVAVLIYAWRPLGVAVLGLILAISFSDTSMYQDTPLKSDFRSAAAYVQAHNQAGDRLLFQIAYNEDIYAYYGGPLQPGSYAEGPYTNHGESEAEVDTWMTAQTAGAPAIWLVASEVSMSDNRNLTEAWLAGHGQITDQGIFTLVTVTRYQLSPR